MAGGDFIIQSNTSSSSGSGNTIIADLRSTISNYKFKSVKRYGYGFAAISQGGRLFIWGGGAQSDIRYSPLIINSDSQHPISNSTNVTSIGITNNITTQLLSGVKEFVTFDDNDTRISEFTKQVPKAGVVIKEDGTIIPIGAYFNGGHMFSRNDLTFKTRYSTIGIQT
jgi:hypothetical protein